MSNSEPIIIPSVFHYGDDAIQFYQFMSDLEKFYLNGGKHLHYSIAPNAKLGDIIREINRVNKEHREGKFEKIDPDTLDDDLPITTVDEFLAPKENSKKS